MGVMYREIPGLECGTGIGDRGVRENVEYAIAKHADIQLLWSIKRTESQSHREHPISHIQRR